MYQSTEKSVFDKGGKVREIKFRQPVFIKGEFKSFHYWGFISNDIFVGPEIHYMTIQEALEKSQQYTGLKDKNGKEIYEGDILIIKDLQPSNFSRKRPTTSNIICDDFVVRNFIEDSYTLKQQLQKEIEVIGNIYENPKLIKRVMNSIYSIKKKKETWIKLSTKNKGKENN